MSAAVLIVEVCWSVMPSKIQTSFKNSMSTCTSHVLKHMLSPFPNLPKPSPGSLDQFGKYFPFHPFDPLFMLSCFARMKGDAAGGYPGSVTWIGLFLPDVKVARCYLDVEVYKNELFQFPLPRKLLDACRESTWELIMAVKGRLDVKGFK